jgi:hypothetical protein
MPDGPDQPGDATVSNGPDGPAAARTPDSADATGDDPGGVGLDVDVGMPVSRRTVVRVGAAAVAGAGGVAALSFESEPALAASFERESVAVATHDGRIEDVTITPTVTMAWDGAKTTVETCRMGIAATKAGSTDTVCEADGIPVPDDADGSMTCDDMGTHSVIEDGPYELADFRARREGATTRTTVTLRLDAAVCDGDGSPIATTTAHPRFVVKVTNEEVTVTVTGSMNPGVET